MAAKGTAEEVVKVPAQKSFQAAYDAYLETVRQAWKKFADKAQDLQQDYWRTLREAAGKGADGVKQAQDAFETSQRAQQSVWNETTQQLEDAFRAFRKAAQHGFSTVDLDQVDPATLAAIGHSFMIVAQHAGSSQPR